MEDVYHNGWKAFETKVCSLGVRVATRVTLLLGILADKGDVQH